MSAVAAPPQKPLDQKTKSPMMGLPPIPKHNTVAEAQSQRQTWVAPKVIPGETVFYRPAGNGKQNEFPAIITRQLNKTFSLLVSQPNQTFREVGSVAYWDHTEDDPKETGDPHAPHNNNGTFRRTDFGNFLSSLLDNLGSLPDMAAELVTIRAELDKIKAEMKRRGSGESSSNKA